MLILDIELIAMLGMEGFSCLIVILCSREFCEWLMLQAPDLYSVVLDGIGDTML